MSLTAADHLAALEAARTAGVRHERAAVFTKSLDLEAIARDASGALDGPALTAAVGALAADVPEFLHPGAVPAPPGASRRAPAHMGGPQVESGATVYPGGPDAEVSALLKLMRSAVGLGEDGGLR